MNLEDVANIPNHSLQALCSFKHQLRAREFKIHTADGHIGIRTDDSQLAVMSKHLLRRKMLAVGQTA